MSDAVRNAGTPRGTDVLRDIIARASTTVTVDATGKVKGGGVGMTLANGLYAAFGREKPQEDVDANRKTLTNLLDLVRKEAGAAKDRYGFIGGADYAERVMDRVMRTETQLSGDARSYTVAERLQRGTYVSSDLAQDILNAVNQAMKHVKNENKLAVVAQNLRMERHAKLMPVNEDAIARFLGRPTKNEGVLATAANAIGGLMDKIAGKGDSTPFERMLTGLRERGLPFYPASNKAFWDTFEGYWKTAARDPNSAQGKSLEQFERMMRCYASKASANGEVLTEGKIRSRLEDLLTNPIRLGKFQEMANQSYVQNITEDKLIGALRAWRDLQPDEVKAQISQNDCDWLAEQLWLSKDKDQLIQAAPSGWRDRIKDSLERMTSPGEVAERRGAYALFGRMADEVAKNFTAQHPPLDLSDRERMAFYKAKYPATAEDPRQLQAYDRFLHPTPMGPRELAKLLGDAVKAPLLERHERQERLNAPETNELRAWQAQLRRNMQPFDHLLQQQEKYAGRDEVTTNRPTKAADFVKSLMLDPVVAKRVMAEVETKRQADNEATYPGDWPVAPPRGAPAERTTAFNNWLDGHKQEYNAYTARQAKEMMHVENAARAIYDANFERFAVLDDYVSFSRELEELRAKPGGLSGLPEDELRKLDERADQIKSDTGRMMAYTMHLNRQFAEPGDEVASLTAAMWTAAADIDAGLDTYAHATGKGFREALRAMEKVINTDLSRLGQPEPRPEEAGAQEPIGGPPERPPPSPPAAAVAAKRLDETGDNLRKGLEELRNSRTNPFADPAATARALKSALVAANQEAAAALETHKGDGAERVRASADQLRELVDGATKAVVEIERSIHGRQPDVPAVESWNVLAERHDWRVSTNPFDE